MNEVERPAQSRVWRWRRAIGESDLPATTRDILRVLSEFMDREGGSCFPTVTDVARKCGRDRGTISDHLKIAEQAGWVEIQNGTFGGQKWRRQSYVARWPQGAGADASADDVAGDLSDEKVGEFAVEGGGVTPHDVAAQSPKDNTSPLTSPNTTPEMSAGARVLARTDRQRINRDFLLWLPTWPGYHRYSDASARREWFALSENDRRSCIRLTPAYLRLMSGKVRSNPATYLREKAWEGLPTVDAETLPEKIEAKSFSPLWMAARFSFLLQEPRGQIVLTAFDKRRIDAGQRTLEEVRREKLQINGWPAVNAMMSAMKAKQPFMVAAALDDLAGAFRSVKRDGELYAAWGRLHALRGWPFFTFTPNYVPFPTVDLTTVDLDAAVDAAMTEFAELLSRI